MTVTENKESLTVGRLPLQILLFSFPLMFSNILQVLFNMSDIAVVGRFAGSKALGAVGSTSIIVMLFTGIQIGMGSGVNAIIARTIGENRPDNTKKAVHTSVLLCTAVGIAVMLFGLFGSRWLLELLGTKSDLIDGAEEYLKIYSFGMPALGIFNFGNAVYSAAGETRKPLVFLSASGVLNVLLNLFLVIVCRRDVDGVAMASIISQYTSAILVMGSLSRGNTSYTFRLSDVRIDRFYAKQVLSLGLPASLQNSVFAVANLFIQAGLNSFDTVVVKGSSAACNADSLVYDVMAAFYTACSSFIGQNYGAGKRERVIRSYFISLAYSFIAGAVLGVGLVLVGNGFLSLFTTEADVAAAGMDRLRVMGFSYAVSAFMDCTIAASRGIGKSFVPTVIVIMGSCVFRVIWVFTVFAHFHTITSLYLLYVCSWTLTAIFEIGYFAKSYREVSKKMM